MIFSSKMTEYSQIMSVIVRVITKPDDRDTGVRFFITSMRADRIEQPEVLSPMNQHFDKIWEIN